ncbi:fatty acid desaturase [Hartmannibacter diazotrophicus]|nr:fatty acid desaturase [Hartmannibacter diazotrophicus]
MADTSAPPVSGQEEAAAESVNWTRALARYRDPDIRRSLLELCITAVPFVGLWALSLIAVKFGWYWASAILAVLGAGFLLRLFMIQHDCGHGAFFPGRRGNDWTGRVLSIITFTPYDMWRRAHAVHHASCGNLDHRGIGDVDTLTVREYLGRSRWGRFAYRLYRHPAIMFGLGPSWLFLLQNRLPVGFMRNKGWTPWISTMATNAAIVAVIGLLAYAIGPVPLLLVHLPIMLIAATIGVWLFFVQHQFEETHWETNEGWNFQEAALHGSSHYDLPGILRWFTANIGMHHVHHLSSRIPYYRLPEVLRDHPELRDISRLTLWQSFQCVRLTLWDEERRKLISFKETRALYGA